MAVSESRALPPQYVEDLQKDYGTQLTATTAAPLNTGLFSPTVAGQDPPNTCLLYTSPSPRDRTRSRMPSSA